MVVICEECGLKYQVDTSKIVGDKARFKCKGCSTSIVVEKNELEDDDISSLEDALLAAEKPDEGEELQDKPGEADLEDGNLEKKAQVEEPVGESTDVGGSGSAEKEKKAGMGLTSKVILLMLLVGLLPGISYFALSFNQTNKQIVSETNKTGKTITTMLASQVDEWLDKNIRVLNAIADTPAMKSMSRFDQEIMLKAIQRQYPWMYLVFTTDRSGMNVSRSDGSELKDYTDRQYVKDIMDGADISWQNLIGKTSKKPALVIAVPIKRGDITVGVLASAMTRETLSELVTTYGEGRTGSSFLVDENDKVVAHRENAFVLQQRDMSSHPLVKAAGQGEPQRVEFVDADGRKTIGFAKQTELGWTLAIQQEKSEAFAPLVQAQRFAYYMLGGTILLIVLIAYFAAKAVVTPITRLTDAANRISIGDLDVEIATTSKDEIGELAAAIMRMQDSIRLSIARLARRRR